MPMIVVVVVILVVVVVDVAVGLARREEDRQPGVRGHAQDGILLL